LDEFVRKNLSMSISEQESQKYWHNQVKNKYFKQKKIVEDTEGNLLMITNGEEEMEKEENVEKLIEEAAGESPREVVVGPGMNTTSLKTNESTKEFQVAVYTGPNVTLADVFTEGEYLATKRKEFQKELLNAVHGVKQYINMIREDWKGLKMRPSAAAQIRA